MILSPALIRYHARTLVQNPATGIFLGFGWMLATILTLSYGGFLAANHAGLELLYGFTPWVLCLLIPALTMGVAEETARGVTERLATLPFNPVQRVLSRFLVLWVLLGLWLLGLWPMALTVIYLGSPDYGAMFSGLIGLWLLSAPMLAASLFVACKASGSVTGFLLGLGACLVLTLSGSPQTVLWLSQTVPNFMAVPLIAVLQTITPLAALGQFISGFLSLGAVAVLGAYTLIFLVLLLPKVLRQVPHFVIAACLLIFALIPPVARMGIDTTADRLHTLSPATVAALKSLKGHVTFTLAQSANNPDIPPEIIANAIAARKMLYAMQAVNPSHITVNILNPDKSPPTALKALQMGYEEQVLPSGTSFFSGLAATIDGDLSHTSLIRKFSSDRRPFLEFDIMALLTEAQRTAKQHVMVLTNINLDSSLGIPRWLGDIGIAYVANPLEPNAKEVPAGTNLLLIIGNFPLPDATLAAVQTYLENGGSIFWLADPLWRNQPAELITTEGTKTVADLFATYGLHIDESHVVGDLSQATPIAQEKTGYSAYPFWLSLDETNLNAQQPFATFVDNLLFAEAGPVSASGLKKGLTYTPIVTTSPHAQLMPRSAFNATPAELISSKLTGPESKQTLAAMVTGTFGAKPGTLVVVNDIDWLADDFALRAVGSGGPGHPLDFVPLNSNHVLFYNALQYAMGETTLVELRGKATTRRTLTRVETLLNELTRRTTILEQKLDAELYNVNTRLADLQANPNDTTTAEKHAEIEAYRQQQFLLRQQLRELRAKVRNQLQGLETSILLLNLLLMPVLLASGLYLYRRRQNQ